MIVTFTLPEDLELVSLAEAKQGWFVYLRPRGTLHLKGAAGATPQAAVDTCTRIIREWLRDINYKPQRFPLNLGDL